MLKIIGTVAAVVIAGATMGAIYPGQQPTTAIPADQAAKVNPVKPSVESIERAKKIYSIDCSMCHGDDGSGKTDLATSMNLHLKDFRDAATFKDRKDGELYYTIETGSASMPGEGNRAKPDEVWNLVIYLRSFSDPSILPTKK